MSDDHNGSVWIDVLLFILILFGVIYAKRKRGADDDD